MAKNERNTERIVRDHFAADGFPGLVVEEQRSEDETIRKCLAVASKKAGGKGGGAPEFIVHAPSVPNLIVLVECKSDPKQHASPGLDKPQAFAADGAIHYARHLSKKFDVIAVAVSGETTASLRVTSYRWNRGDPTFSVLEDEHGPVEALVRFDDYRLLRSFDPAIRTRSRDELMKFSRDLHNYLRDYAKVSEAEKPLLVSGVLLALQDESFALTYHRYSPDALPKALFAALERQIDQAQVPAAKKEIILQPYTFLTTHPELAVVTPKKQESPLQRLVRDMDEKVRPFIADYGAYDVIGEFYGEFLKYTGGDKKSLGIVLTPRHITQLFAALANVRPTDTVLDTCCGTAGYLITSMADMDSKCAGDEDQKRRVRAHQLVGVEQQPHMFALAASNMILRGDGLANLYRGSCFDPSIIDRLEHPPLDEHGNPRHGRPNVGMINPPYAQKGDTLQELDFVKNMLDRLVPDGVGIAILPMSCVIMPSQAKKDLMAAHTLEAVMSMPTELFYPVGTVTAIMVWRAHQPHRLAARPTWFGYWKEDGFVKTKDKGRIDRYDRWEGIKAEWLDQFHNRREIPGKCVQRAVGPNDEWCAEAYMETDYGMLSISDYSEAVRNYALFCAVGMLGGDDVESADEAVGE